MDSKCETLPHKANRDRDLLNTITTDTGRVLYDLFLPKRNRALRDKGHNFTP